MEPRFFTNTTFARFLKAIKFHAFHNPNHIARGGFGHAKDYLHARNEHMDPTAGRRNLLYESSPAGTMVDGSPRAASVNLHNNQQLKHHNCRFYHHQKRVQTESASSKNKLHLFYYVRFYNANVILVARGEPSTMVPAGRGS